MVIKDFFLDLLKYNLTDHDIDFALEDKLPDNQDLSVALIVPDHTRPFRAFEHKLLNAMLKKYGKDKVDIFVATGMHRQSTYEELLMKWGDNIANCRVVQNNPVRSTWQDLYARNYFKISYSNPMPHNHMGMSGGMKVVMPGLGSAEDAMRFHAFNRVQASQWHDALAHGINFFIGCAYSQWSDPIELCFVPSHEQFKEWRERIRDYYRFKLPEEMPDTALLVPTVKKGDIVLSMNSLLVSAVKPIVKRGGVIAIQARLNDGAGTHYMFQGFNGVHEIWYDNIFKRELEGRELHFITDCIPQRALQAYFSNIEIKVHRSYDHFFAVDRGLVHRYIGPEMMIGE